MKITVINSKGHWDNGWAITPKVLKYLTDSFGRSDLEVDIYEVSELSELESILKVLDTNSLVFPNAYYVNRFKDSKDFVWIGDVIDRYQRPFVGSGSQALRDLLQKDSCQRILKANGILVPEFAVIKQSDIGKEKEIMAESQLSFPAVVKPTTLSASVGITQDSIVHNEKEAIAQIQMIIKIYQTDVIVEEFLSSEDLTVCYLPGNSGSPKLLSSYYIVPSKSGTTSILGREERFLDWGTTRKIIPVEGETLLNQFKEIVPRVCKVLNVKDITRVDGRLDRNGIFRVFDVNAYPGLDPIMSTQTAQCRAFYPNHSEIDSYDALVNTILLSACHRYNIPIPQSVQEHNLFTVEAPVFKQTKA